MTPPKKATGKAGKLRSAAKSLAQKVGGKKPKASTEPARVAPKKPTVSPARPAATKAAAPVRKAAPAKTTAKIIGKKTAAMAAPKKAAPKKPAPKKPAKKAPAKKTTAKKTPARKAPAKKAPAKKTTAKKTPAKKAPAKKTTAKKTTAKKTTAKKTTAKKTPAKKTPAKKTTAKKTPAKKTTTRAAAPKGASRKATRARVTRPPGGSGATQAPARRTRPAKFDAKALATIKANLTQEKEDLQKQQAELEEDSFVGTQSDMTGEVGLDEDFADAGTATFDRERDLSIQNNIRDIVEQITRALERIEEGTYGICERCGQPIDAARLKALPYTGMCLDCKRREERVR